MAPVMFEPPAFEHNQVMGIPIKGDRFPDFELDGSAMRTIQGGQPLVVLVWRTGCSTSRLAVPFFQRLQDRHPKALVLGVSQEDEGTMREYNRQNGLTFEHVSDSGLRITRQLGVS